MSDTPNSESENSEQQAAPESTGYAPDQLDAGGKRGDRDKADVNLDLVLDIPVNVSLRVGSTDISIRDLVSLVEGSVIALDRDAGEAMDVLVNGTLIAHGEIVVIDNHFGVRLTDVVSTAERIENLN